MSHTPGTTTLTSAELQDLWFGRTAEAGWVFASDWHDPAIDALCEACVKGENLWPAAERLGGVRADSGVSLGETLADVDGLTAVLAGLDTEVLHRAVSLGWADRMMAPRPTVFDPLTGLVSDDYLRTRMGEVYRAAEVADTKVSSTHALVVVRVDLTGRAGWDRITPLDPVRRCHAHRFRRRPDAGPPCRPYGGRAVRTRGDARPPGSTTRRHGQRTTVPGRSAFRHPGLDRATAGFIAGRRRPDRPAGPLTVRPGGPIARRQQICHGVRGDAVEEPGVGDQVSGMDT